MRVAGIETRTTVGQLLPTTGRRRLANETSNVAVNCTDRPRTFWAKCSFPVSLTVEPDRGNNPGGLSRAETETSGLRTLRSCGRSDLANDARLVARPTPSQRCDRNTLRTLAFLCGVRSGVSLGA